MNPTPIKPKPSNAMVPGSGIAESEVLKVVEPPSSQATEPSPPGTVF
jgi:hypothetical protein